MLRGCILTEVPMFETMHGRHPARVSLFGGSARRLHCVIDPQLPASTIEQMNISCLQNNDRYEATSIRDGGQADRSRSAAKASPPNPGAWPWPTGLALNSARIDFRANHSKSLPPNPACHPLTLARRGGRDQASSNIPYASRCLSLRNTIV